MSLFPKMIVCLYFRALDQKREAVFLDLNGILVLVRRTWLMLMWMATSRSSDVRKQLGSCGAAAVWISPRVFKGTSENCLSDSGMDLPCKRREDWQAGSLLTLSEIALL